jgi:mycothiol synthase
VVELTWHDSLADDDAEAVRELLLAARDTDGRPEIDQAGPLPREFRGGLNLLAHKDKDLAGCAHLNAEGDAFGRQVAELIVHPRHRRQGVGTSLTEAVIGRADGRPLRIWSHGDHPGAARIAEKFGLPRARELLKMRLDFEAPHTPRLPVQSWPPGVRVRTFVSGQDEPDVIAVNGRAFDWHPEQGALTVDDLTAAEAEAWFDPDGFFLAINPEDRLLGFHWTKVHAGSPPVGEVYVVGVDPEAQGGGLGKALTLAGLHHLHRSGLGQVILYVEADNAPAVTVYTQLGFATVEVDVQYAVDNER